MKVNKLRPQTQIFITYKAILAIISTGSINSKKQTNKTL